MAEQEMAVRVAVMYEEPDRTVVTGVKHENVDTLTASELMQDIRNAAIAIGYAEQSVAEAMVEVGGEWLSLHKEKEPCNEDL